MFFDKTCFCFGDGVSMAAESTACPDQFIYVHVGYNVHDGVVQKFFSIDSFPSRRGPRYSSPGH